ncbi:MAG: CbtA family protein [Rhodospirillales bacterium]|nr:CbtA family protein [Rhodospirillales bacterium]
MLRRILVTALVAGAVAGIVVSLVQFFQVLPLIGEAEQIEAAALSHVQTHGQVQAQAQVSGDTSRLTFTIIYNILAGVAFGLLLVSAYVLSGRPVDWHRGVIWGLAGFVAVGLAPALGMMPSPPGSDLGPLAERQVWWLLCGSATAGGLAFLAFAKAWPYRLVGVSLLVVPHLIGAPGMESPAPDPDFAFRFAVASLSATGVFWAVLGGVSGYVYRKLG